MNLGAFSISLAVKDLTRSREFYEKLGFTAFGGDGESWQMLRNGPTVLGLFQGMFEKNMLTFNPGWNARAEALAEFTDVRELRREAEARALNPLDAESTESGPASFMLEDPTATQSSSTSTCRLLTNTQGCWAFQQFSSSRFGRCRRARNLSEFPAGPRAALSHH